MGQLRPSKAVEKAGNVKPPPSRAPILIPHSEMGKGLPPAFPGDRLAALMKRVGVNGVVGIGWMAFAFALAVSFASAPDLSAQFHAKKSNGQTQVNPRAVATAQQQAGMQAGMAPGAAVPVVGGGLGGGDMILPAGAREAFGEHNVRLGEMTGKPVDIWGRSIHHGDGTYTESKQDNVTNTLEQITKSKNGVKLQVRKITLDASGRPSEVHIYDGRDQFKYRGLLVYDTFGRFAEEQIHDAKGTLIRRKVQTYDARGEKLPLRSWDYVANVPEDLKLVITRDDDTAARPTPTETARADTPEKKPLNLRGIFGGRKKN